MEADDAKAFWSLGNIYVEGGWGLRRDAEKGLELWLRAVELGEIHAHNSIADILLNDEFIPKDPARAVHHYQQGSIGGDESSRHNLAIIEGKNGNFVGAMRHFIIAAGTGSEQSLDAVKKAFVEGLAPKALYELALRVHHKYLDEVRSDQREKASARKKIMHAEKRAYHELRHKYHQMD